MAFKQISLGDLLKNKEKSQAENVKDSALGVTIDNSSLAKKLNIPITKIRRWTKEVLPPDSKAVRRSGFKRDITVRDGLKIFLTGYLVSEMGFGFVDAKRLLKEIFPNVEKLITHSSPTAGTIWFAFLTRQRRWYWWPASGAGEFQMIIDEASKQGVWNLRVLNIYDLIVHYLRSVLGDHGDLLDQLLKNMSVAQQ